MESRSASASGKIILSGEYAVLFGKRAVAVPADKRLTVSFVPKRTGGITIVWKNAPTPWIEYIRRIFGELEAATGPLHGTVTIESGLPLGKGMGSSTALVIASTRCLLGGDSEAIARRMEDAMNPGHSGLDFAVIWHGRPTLFMRGKTAETITLPQDILEGSQLIDTGMPNETTPELVAWVRSRQAKLKQPIETIGQCTERLLRGEPLKEIMRDHHRAQVALGVVPEVVRKKITMIEAAGGSAKVLGAGARTGGGGMVLTVR
ncbi:MAG: hypothetical protein WC840_00880 [Candidatus Peribacteraceae bacterium]